VKRGFDIIVAATLLLFVSPLFLAVAGLIRVKLGPPIFFRQQRPGLGGKPFEMIKFRTMRDATDRTGRPLADAERLTGFGRALRSTSLDELPELINILRGEMSLVGPRPLLMDYLPLYSAEQARRHNVRPGLTGWAQINGRNALSWDEKFALDLWYVDHHNMILDIAILCRTVRKVLFREDISAEGEATMTPFEGNNDDVTL